MRAPLTLRLAAGVVFSFGTFTALASIIFLAGTGLLGEFRHPFWQWWLYLFYGAGDPVVRHWLVVSGVPGAAVPLVAALAFVVRGRAVHGWTLRHDQPPARAVASPIRSPTDNHGHARWMTLAEARDLWPGPGPKFGGIVVGEAYAPGDDPVAGRRFKPQDPKSWGRGGKAPLFVDPCAEGSTHSLMIAGSGSFKTVSAVSTLLTWTGSTVVLDPSAELGPMLAADRRRIGHRVFVLHPNTAHEVGFNVLDWIDPASPMAETDVRAVVDWVCGDLSRDDANADFFKSRGKSLVTCLLTHMLWDDALAPELKTLRTLRAALVTPEPELRAILGQVHQHSKSRMARDLAGALKDLVDETFSGIYTNADEDTAWLSNRAFAALVSGNSFSSADLAAGRTSVFVCIPLKALHSTPAVARVIIGALLNAAYEADGEVEGRILFLLDEAARLGPMGIVTTARDAGRKYGITLHLLYQSVGQIIEQWGAEGKRAWYESASWRAYAAVKDEETAKELAATVGEYGVLAWSEGQNTGTHGKGFEMGSRSRGHTQTFHELKRPLIRPEEIMHDAREDEMFVIPRGGRPLRCGRAIYFRRPEFVERVAPNRFATQQENSHAG
jgi:type IV secretion system protein VirD4